MTELSWSDPGFPESTVNRNYARLFAICLSLRYTRREQNARSTNATPRFNGVPYLLTVCVLSSKEMDNEKDSFEIPAGERITSKSLKDFLRMIKTRSLFHLPAK